MTKSEKGVHRSNALECHFRKKKERLKNPNTQGCRKKARRGRDVRKQKERRPGSQTENERSGCPHKKPRKDHRCQRPKGQT